MYAGERHFANEDVIKDKIVDAYRRGVCDCNGRTLPRRKQGMAGKGSHFSAALKPSKCYEQNYVLIFGHE